MLFLLVTVEESFSNESSRSRKGEESSDNSILRRGNCSEIWEPGRKSRRLSENIPSICQRKISELDGVNADSELEVAVQECPKDSIPAMVEEVFSQDVQGPVCRSQSEAIATDETTSKDESANASSITDASAAPQVLFVVDESSEEITPPVEKSDLLDEAVEGLATRETTYLDEGKITASAY